LYYIIRTYRFSTFQTMDYSNKTRTELIAICKDRNIKGYSKLHKLEIIRLIQNSHSKSELNIQNNLFNNNLLSESRETNTGTLKMVDLFAGTGAFTYAFQKTGRVECVFANDMAEPSKKIYDANFAHPLTLGDLNDISVEDIPSHDILTGGFPCQPFSIAGRQEGFNDTRSNVFWKILEIIERHNPKCVILENVKNLVSHDNGNTFEIIQRELLRRNYTVTTKVLNTAEITGVPQHRERIYIVCWMGGVAPQTIEGAKKQNATLPRPTNDDTTHTSRNINEGARANLGSPKGVSGNVVPTLDFPTIPKRPISQFLEQVVPQKYYYTEASSTWGLIQQHVVKPDTVYQYRRVYVRENKSQECPTLTANMGTGGHNVPLILDNTKKIRKFTPRECFNLQGFPASYVLPNLSDAMLYKLAGNAVSVPVVELIANRIVEYLTNQ